MSTAIKIPAQPTFYKSPICEGNSRRPFDRKHRRWPIHPARRVCRLDCMFRGILAKIPARSPPILRGDVEVPQRLLSDTSKGSSLERFSRAFRHNPLSGRFASFPVLGIVVTAFSYPFPSSMSNRARVETSLKTLPSRATIVASKTRGKFVVQFAAFSLITSCAPHFFIPPF